MNKKTNILAAVRLCLLPIVALAGDLKASTVVFQENFTTTSISGQPNPYLGGWFVPQVALQQWTGPSEASITTGTLTVTATSGTRTAGIVLPPTLFLGAGNYKLTLDVTGYAGDANDYGVVTVWAGSGYGAAGETGNSLVVDTYTASLSAKGTAVVSLLASQSFTAAGARELTFSYDGTSAVALFLGATTGGYPFPEVAFDNISITAVPEPEVIPEPSVMALSAVLAAGALMRRRRR